MKTKKQIIEASHCVAVSACLLGHNCKYNGGNNLDEKIVELLSGKKIIPVCPESMGGLKAPRKPSEIKNNGVFSEDGNDVTEFFKNGAKNALKKVIENNAEVVILKSRSPSCGVKQIYDGSFSGKVIQGKGIFASELERAGIKTVDAEDL